MAQSAKEKPPSTTQRGAKRINFPPMETKTSRLRAQKVASSGVGGIGSVGDKFYSNTQPGTIPNSGAHSRKQSGEGTSLA